MAQRYIKEWFLNVLAWGVITNLYSLAILTNMQFIIKVAGIEEELKSNSLLSYFLSDFQYLEASIFGLSFGTLFYVINLGSDKILAHMMPFGKRIIFKTLLYVVAVILVFFLMATAFEFFNVYPVDMRQVLEETVEFHSPLLYISGFTFLLFTAALVNFLIQVSYKFGPKTVLPLFLGKYYKPKNENRIFLFLDLKNSTGIAEELGHVRYSKLIQDCYFDLNKIVFYYNADIYQYVGDEVVLTWRNRKNNLNKYALKATFAFRKLLEKRRDYYLKNYGVLPEFKGGLHLGEVSVAEIGEIKKEIAYHGDVINTTSRLQEVAKKYERSLVVSEFVINEITNYKGLTLEEMPFAELKGKKHRIGVYSVEESVRTPDMAMVKE